MIGGIYSMKTIIIIFALLFLAGCNNPTPTVPASSPPTAAPDTVPSPAPTEPAPSPPPPAPAPSPQTTAPIQPPSEPVQSLPPPVPDTVSGPAPVASYDTSSPPALEFAAPPDVIVLPDTPSVCCPGISVDLFFWNGWWWRPWEVVGIARAIMTGDGGITIMSRVFYYDVNLERTLQGP